MTEEYASKVQLHALQAIKELSAILMMDKGDRSSEEYELIKEGIGRSIGQIQMGVLEPLYKEYPQLDDLD
jgi:hypothetical protein